MFNARYHAVAALLVAVLFLPALISESLLMWCQPAEKRDVNIGVMARDVYVSMMYDYMFPVPYVRTSANQIHRHGREPVDPGVI